MQQYRQRLGALVAGAMLAVLAACASRIPPEVPQGQQGQQGQQSQPQAPTNAASPGGPEEIVVTGSRITPSAGREAAAAGDAAAAPRATTAGAQQRRAGEVAAAGSAAAGPRTGGGSNGADSRAQNAPQTLAPQTLDSLLYAVNAGAIPNGSTLSQRTRGFRPQAFGASRAAALSAARPGEEIWIIATPSSDPSAAAPDEESGPGTGAMLATLPTDSPAQEPTTIPLPLEHTEVKAVITGYVGTVDVTQQFANPYDEKIEAVYLFPLPEKAAVREFVMTIGERRIRGILREKEEAEQIYLEARAQGYQASLLTQHRPNIFEQKVANIEPGKRIDVNIRYFHTLAYHDGWYSFVFPTVVGPRYNPPGFKDPVAALPRTEVGKPPSGTAVRYLRPDERSAHDIAISVEIDAGVAIEELDANHPIRTVRNGPSSATVELATEGTIPNRDFVLDFRVAGETIKSNLLTYTDPETSQGYFTLMVYPPADLDSMERQAVEMVFVLDCSGSMSGRPLAQAKAAVLTALDRLGPDDTFQILRFSNSVSRFGPAPVRATEDNLRLARYYVRQLNGSGGTRMIEGIRAALGFPHDENRLRFVTFLTDGYIGNEAQIIGEVHRLIGASRIFSFGVGNSVNRFLLERMASEGRGAVAYLGLEDSAEEIMSFFFERISHPALMDLKIDWDTMYATDVYPSRLPDLFVGRPVVVTGKYMGEPGEVTVRGRAGGRDVSVAIGSEPSAPERSFIASLWARLRIADLADRRAWTADPYGELARAIRDTALEYELMSQYTAFVAVDASERTAGTAGTTVHQAVPVPDGVRYETTVAEE